MEIVKNEDAGVQEVSRRFPLSTTFGSFVISALPQEFVYVAQLTVITLKISFCGQS